MARYHALKRITLKMRSSARLTVKKAVLDMSINETSYLEPLTQLPSGEPGIVSEGHIDM